MTHDDVARHFEREGWSPRMNTFTQLRFRDPRGLRDGIWREAAVETGFISGEHRIEVHYSAAELRYRVTPDHGMPFRTEEELEIILAGTTPKSFRHIEQDLAEAAHLPNDLPPVAA